MLKSFYRNLVLSLSLLTISQAYCVTEKPLKIASDEDLGFFVVPRAETMSNIKRVGLLPVTLPAAFEDREDVKANLQALITNYLTKAGIEVVAPDTYVKSFDRLNAQLGGVYSAITGDIKSAQYDAAQTTAKREFIEKEHLNALVSINIRQVEADFYYSNAFFNGATEYSLGRLPPGFIAGMFTNDTNGRGTLSAWSLLIQIKNKQDKVIYGRFGGIQLANYYDPSKTKGAPSGFLYVPIKDFFRDQVRLERAVRIATDSLLKSPEQIARDEDNAKENPRLIDPASLPLPPLGEPRKIASPLQIPRDEILASVHQVVVMPLNTGKFEMPAEIQTRYLENIKTELQKLNLELIVSPKAMDIFANEFQKAGPMYDPLTGKQNEARIKATRKKAIQAIDPTADAILITSLVKVNAPHFHGDSKWDGASQNAVDLGPVKKRGIFEAPENSSEGSVSAVSLNLQLRDLDDKILYLSRGGIQLIQQLQGEKAIDLAPTELFKEPRHETAAAHYALRDLVLTPEELEKELSPNKNKVAKKTKKEKKNDKNENDEKSE